MLCHLLSTLNHDKITLHKFFAKKNASFLERLNTMHDIFIVSLVSAVLGSN